MLTSLACSSVGMLTLKDYMKDPNAEQTELNVAATILKIQQEQKGDMRVDAWLFGHVMTNLEMAPSVKEVFRLVKGHAWAFCFTSAQITMISKLIIKNWGCSQKLVEA